jgi:hypothetical protein
MPYLDAGQAKGLAMSKDGGRRRGLTRDAAETIAAQGLAFLAEDPGRLAHFLALTGLEPDDLRVRAASPEVLAAVLEHLAGNESLLLVFAAGCKIAPQAVGEALALLGGAAP